MSFFSRVKITLLCNSSPFFFIKIFSRKRVAAAFSSRPFCLQVFALYRLYCTYEILSKAESLERLFSIFRPRYWIRPRAFHGKTHIRSVERRTHERKRVSHLALIYHAFWGDALRIRFASRLFLDIIIPLFRGSAFKSSHHMLRARVCICMWSQ